MPQSKEDRALVDINNAWNEICPTADQGFVWRLYSEMAGETKHEIIKAAVGRLYDGLAYGNWPSAK